MKTTFALILVLFVLSANAQFTCRIQSEKYNAETDFYSISTLPQIVSFVDDKNMLIFQLLKARGKYIELTSLVASIYTTQNAICFDKTSSITITMSNGESVKLKYETDPTCSEVIGSDSTKFSFITASFTLSQNNIYDLLLNGITSIKFNSIGNSMLFYIPEKIEITKSNRDFYPIINPQEYFRLYLPCVIKK